MSQCVDCCVVWQDTEILCKERDVYKRLVKESMILRNSGYFSNMSIVLTSPIKTVLKIIIYIFFFFFWLVIRLIAGRWGVVWLKCFSCWFLCIDCLLLKSVLDLSGLPCVPTN